MKTFYNISTIILISLAFIFFHSGTTFAQYEWTKYAENPVFTAEP